MKYTTIKPAAQLTGIVRYFWILESQEAYTHFSMPDACAELIFHFHGRFAELLNDGRDQPSFTAGVHGQSRQARKFEINCGFGMLGAYLYPQAIPALFNCAAPEVSNQMIDLDLLLGSEGKSLEDAIANAKDNVERVSLLEAFISRRHSRNDNKILPVFHSVQTIIDQKGLVKIKDMASEACLSERQFKRQFHQYAGFSPKLYARIVRFQSAMELYEQKRKSLTDIALECGYYDQSHFISDFTEFAGLSPKTFFSGKSGATVWRDKEFEISDRSAGRNVYGF